MSPNRATAASDFIVFDHFEGRTVENFFDAFLQDI
jgi:hypothetical protein